MGHINHVRSAKNRQLLNQPWYLDDMTFGKQPPKADVQLAPMRQRFTPAERKAYDNRLHIITKLRAGEKPEALAREHIVSVRFIRWIDGRSRA